MQSIHNRYTEKLGHIDETWLNKRSLEELVQLTKSLTGDFLYQIEQEIYRRKKASEK